MSRSGSRKSSSSGGGHLLLLAFGLFALVSVGASLGAGSGKSPSNRILGGQNVKPGEVPFLVSLLMKRANKESLCGGVIIDQRHILTAAHCVTKTQAPDISAYVGGYENRGKTGNLVGIEQVKIYEDYEWPDDDELDILDFDIAILRTKSPIKFNETTKPIRLPKDSEVEYEEGTSLTVAGWGRTSNDPSSRSDVPRKVDVPVIDCQDLWSWFDPESPNICAGFEGHGSCMGDSGGPLFRNNTGSPELVGIVSRGATCGEAGEPRFFARVSFFLDWIEETIEDMNKGRP